MVSVGEVGGKSVTYFRTDEQGKSSVATLLVRGATSNILDDVERAIDDAVNVFKAMGRDPRFVVGGGACEIELARRLAKLAENAPGLEQYAMQRFAESLEVVPATLAETCGLDPTSVIADLYAAHEAKAEAAAKDGEPGVGQPLAQGIDVDECAIGDMAAKRVWDLLAAKRSALVLAADAASTILKVDQIIMARRAGGPKIRPPGARDAS